MGNHAFNLSLLASSRYLELGSFSWLDGQFPEMLESLVINLKVDTFSEFWRKHVPSLENLYSLKAIMKCHRKVIDFRGLEFPKNLHTIELAIEKDAIKLSFHYLPSSLKSFCFTMKSELGKSYFEHEQCVCARKFKHNGGSESSDPFHDRQALKQLF
ncbi:unnamed protein product [Ambrosiozyma monospora]|uniref:Unnamed protein product n=1 Tax=Ambrosiozyma monospora TaxID=43982 RepID=A0ACB5T7E8_AMBMO|nr:unnamed protein product [Ambrosiozyma monospora]